MHITRLLLVFLALFCSSIISSSQPNILLFGPPGAGKGTFSDLLLQHGYAHFSLGEQIKQHIKENTAYGQQFAPILKRAYEQRITIDSLIDEPGVRDLVFSLIADFVSLCKENNKPFILDGPIRSSEDVSYLLRLLQEQQITDLAVVLLTIDSSVLIERVANRRVCPQCHAIYNISMKIPVRENFCDICQHELIQRPEDNPELYIKRLEYYESIIAPTIATLIEICTKQQIPLYTFDVNRSLPECLALYRNSLKDGEFFIHWTQENSLQRELQTSLRRPKAISP